MSSPGSKSGPEPIRLTRTPWQTAKFYLLSPLSTAIGAVAVIAVVALLIVTGAVNLPGRSDAAGTVTSSTPPGSTSPSSTPDSTTISGGPPSSTTSTTSSTPPTSTSTSSDATSSTSTSTTTSATTSTSTSPTAPAKITVTLKVGGGKGDALKVAPGSTVAALLTAQKVSLGADDTVKPSPDTKLASGDIVTVTRVSYKTSTKEVAVPQPADQSVDDADMYVGTSVVTQHGHPGKKQVTYRTKVVNGKAGKAEEIDSVVVVQPAATITHVGTKQQPPPTTQQQAPPTTHVQPTTKQQPPPPPPSSSFSVTCSTAATVKVTVSGSGSVSLSMSPGGSWSGNGSVTGSGTLSGPGTVNVTFTGSSYSWSGIGGVCHQ